MEGLAPCLIGGPGALELGETELKRLSGMDSCGPFGLDPAPKPTAPAIKRRKEKRGELRAVRILARLDAARADRDLAIDLRAVLAKASVHARAYVTLLADEGALSDTAARKKLGLDQSAFDAAIDEAEKSFR